MRCVEQKTIYHNRPRLRPESSPSLAERLSAVMPYHTECAVVMILWLVALFLCSILSTRQTDMHPSAPRRSKAYETALRLLSGRGDGRLARGRNGRRSRVMNAYCELPAQLSCRWFPHSFSFRRRRRASR